MIYEPIKENCAFFYHEDVELLFAATSLLQGEPVHKLCSKIYGSMAIDALRKKYRFLFELFQTLSAFHHAGIFEFLRDFPLEHFSPAALRDHLRGMEETELARRYLDADEEIFLQMQAMLAGGDEADGFFGEDSRHFKTYIGMQAFFAHAKRFAMEYLAFAEELGTDAFYRALEEAAPQLEEIRSNVREGLIKSPPLQYSEQLMGKTFHNRGPYARFFFSASLLMPYRAIRFFGENQLLFTSLRPVVQNDAETVGKLKAVAEQTRLNIITLLGEKGSLRGMDIARSLGLSPSTVTHHMEQLKNAGLVLEEPVKNAKYFSVSRHGMKELIERLAKTLGQ
ncbi:MAG TPA: metalloregulator ArsR/SmtB family transcription factor [Clostridia bacterium]|nr:metalloregulator ArsR/SmtB family transcription factor [Clostridia bacterium]